MSCNVMEAVKIYQQIHEDAHVLAALNIDLVLSFLIGDSPRHSVQ